MRSQAPKFAVRIVKYVVPTIFFGVVGNLVYDSYVKDVPISQLLSGLVAVAPLSVFTALVSIVIATYLLIQKWVMRHSTGLRSYSGRLSTSKFHPNTLMPKISSSLDFLGHGGSKWTSNATAFDDMLGRIRKHGRGQRARLLLLDPREDASWPAESNKRIRSILRLRVFLEKFPTTLEVRLYKHDPQFRLVFVNSEYLVVGHYNAYTANSSDSPQLEFDSAQEWSFHSPFKEYFDELWIESSAVAEADWVQLIELAKTRKIDLAS